MVETHVSLNIMILTLTLLGFYDFFNCNIRLQTMPNIIKQQDHRDLCLYFKIYDAFHCVFSLNPNDRKSEPILSTATTLQRDTARTTNRARNLSRGLGTTARYNDRSI